MSIRSINQTDNICGFKIAITPGCHQMSQEQKGKINGKTMSTAVCITIPVQNIANGTEKLRDKFTCDTDITLKNNSLVKTRDRDIERVSKCKKVPRLIFPEMRGSILYTRCCCLHRNGLQDYCPLTQCQGQPQCLVKPWAVCPPGKFIRSRYPELYPKMLNAKCITQ